MLYAWVAGVRCGNTADVENHLEMGKKLLAAGQLADALSHFHAAVGECQHHETIDCSYYQITKNHVCYWDW